MSTAHSFAGPRQFRAKRTGTEAGAGAGTGAWAGAEAWASAEHPAEGFGMIPSILQTYALEPEVESEQEAAPPLATAARLHVQHAAVQSRELFA